MPNVMAGRMRGRERLHDRERGHVGETVTVGLQGAEVASVPGLLFGRLAGVPSSLDLSDLTADRLRFASTVVTPLVSEGFDLIDVVSRLKRANYGGRLVAVAQSVTAEAPMRAEVSDIAPDLELEIVEIGNGPRLLVV